MTCLKNHHKGVAVDVIGRILKYEEAERILKIGADLFITFTCNSKWEEITESLNDGEKPQDRCNVVVRAFKLKVKKFMNLITKEKFFGEPLCYMYSVEW